MSTQNPLVVLQRAGVIYSRLFIPSTQKASVPSVTRPTVASEIAVLASLHRRTCPAKFFCRICDATFTQKTNLRRGLIRVFSICPFLLNLWLLFLDHIHSHLGIRPFECVYCQKTFVTRGVCTRHEKRCRHRSNRLQR